jgi:hypothetical protein
MVTRPVAASSNVPVCILPFVSVTWSRAGKLVFLKLMVQASSLLVDVLWLWHLNPASSMPVAFNLFCARISPPPRCNLS